MNRCLFLHQTSLNSMKGLHPTTADDKSSGTLVRSSPSWMRLPAAQEASLMMLLLATSLMVLQAAAGSAEVASCDTDSTDFLTPVRLRCPFSPAILT